MHALDRRPTTPAYRLSILLAIVTVFLASAHRCAMAEKPGGATGPEVQGQKAQMLIVPDADDDPLPAWDALHRDEAKKSDVWTVSPDGVLRYKGTPLGYIYTKHTFGDFILDLEYRWPEGEAPGRGGILVRTTPPHKIWPKSLEAQINAPNAGDFWGLDGFSLDGPDDRLQRLEHPEFGKLTNLKKTQSVERPAGEWNEYRVTAKGPVVTIEINGKTVNRATSCDTTPGHIALTAEGNPIEFRDVRIKRLPEDN